MVIHCLLLPKFAVQYNPRLCQNGGIARTFTHVKISTFTVVRYLSSISSELSIIYIYWIARGINQNWMNKHIQIPQTGYAGLILCGTAVATVLYYIAGQRNLEVYTDREGFHLKIKLHVANLTHYSWLPSDGKHVFQWEKNCALRWCYDNVLGFILKSMFLILCWKPCSPISTTFFLNFELNLSALFTLDPNMKKKKCKSCGL